MCYGRLTRGQSPACVSACPEGAIQIELVKIAEWKENYKEQANSPGMPSADDSISTTRITLPHRTAKGLHKVDLTHLRTEDAHWPLIIMTVLTQLSVGAFGALVWMQAIGERAHTSAALAALTIAFSALCASTFHLGRPIHAARALKMWRRSWLSREVLLFSMFAGAATIYSAALAFNSQLVSLLGPATALLGICGVGASARLYLAPGRPAWNSPITLLEFFATACLLGTASAIVLSGGGPGKSLALLFAALLTSLGITLKLVRLRFASRHELIASWQLLSSVLLNKLLLRVGLFAAGVLFLLLGDRLGSCVAGLLLLLACEFISRYLFFVSVVPSNIASGYLTKEAA
jgi:DMSO reductase anchor subunit